MDTDTFDKGRRTPTIKLPGFVVTAFFDREGGVRRPHLFCVKCHQSMLITGHGIAGWISSHVGCYEPDCEGGEKI